MVRLMTTFGCGFVWKKDISVDNGGNTLTLKNTGQKFFENHQFPF